MRTPIVMIGFDKCMMVSYSHKGCWLEVLVGVFW